MMRIDELLGFLFDDSEHVLSKPIEEFISTSKPFRAFTEAHSTKIRKKIRTATDTESVQALRFELEIAYRLVQERRFTVEYEKYGLGKQRGPDYTVMFRTRIPFNVEVTRVRQDKTGETEHPAVAKVMEVICQKLGQMPPNVINVLMLSIAGKVESDDLALAGTRLRLLADQKVEVFFAERGFKNAADFYKQFQKLSAMILEPASEDRINTPIWLNPIAKQPLLKELTSIFEKLK